MTMSLGDGVRGREDADGNRNQKVSRDGFRKGYSRSDQARNGGCIEVSLSMDGES
jgi:hypothetical protein